MEISYEFFKQYPVTRILISKIMQGNYPTIKTSYRIKKLVDCLGEEFKIYQSLLAEKEKSIKWENQKIVNEEEIKEVFNELYSHKFTVDYAPLSQEEILSIKDVSPQEVEILQMISEPTAFDSLLT